MKPLKILLVDDEDDVRMTVGLLLGADHHVATEVSSGPEALQALEQSTFDLVITDYRMTGMMGDELAAKIKERWPKMPVIMHTGFNPNHPGADNPVDYILFKPAYIQDIRKAISTVMGFA